MRTLFCLLVLTMPAMANGDAEHGRAIMLEPQKSLCILCHSGPFPEIPFMGTLAPDLSDVGSRYSYKEIRDRIVDNRKFNPDTIMPPFLSLEGLNRISPRWAETTILTEQEVDDIATFLAGLKGETP